MVPLKPLAVRRRVLTNSQRVQETQISTLVVITTLAVRYYANLEEHSNVRAETTLSYILELGPCI